ncbi:MAG TPA: TrmH family RNA methyltransferase [Solirubrobacteraceae bacterium]|nr:TrmH family RNA methyltransferase [Solirubrobacteraceae bacterium]
MLDGALIPRLRRARRDPALAVLEGFHPLKHAIRFGAEIELVLTPDAGGLDALALRLAPDVRGRVGELAREVSPEAFAELVPLPPSTGVVSLARRPAVDVAAVLGSSAPSPVVLLEDPRDLGNLGACIRVSAAADAAAVLSTGSHDPWHPDAVRGAAGLHFALPVAQISSAAALGGPRPLLAIDPDGEELEPARLPPHAVLAFGSEREGLGEDVLARADQRLRIPMRAGVSSLNLATSVAAVLFAWRLAR